MTFPYETPAVSADPDRSLLVYTPQAGSETEERLRFLGSWKATAVRTTP
ncbi:hypothetical protein [Streptomyces sp. NPDC060002]